MTIQREREDIPAVTGARASRVQLFAEVIDRLVVTDVAGRGVAGGLYQAARLKQGEPLTLRAARMLAAVPAGSTVLIATGWPHRPHVTPEVAESDGPPGAAVLARTLAATKEFVPVLVVEPVLVPAMEALALAAGLRPVPPSRLSAVREIAAPLQATAILAMPVDLEQGKRFSLQVFETFQPGAIVVIEKGGLNRAGYAHTSRGHDTTWAIAKGDLLVQRAREAGVPTIAVGDGGNEVGMGLIKEFIREHVKYGARCQCPCQGGIAPEQSVDALVVAAVSNWGAYGVAAALCLLTGHVWEHSAAQEARILEAAAGVGLCDGPSGWVGPVVDGLGSEIHQALVTLLAECVRKCGWEWR